MKLKKLMAIALLSNTLFISTVSAQDFLDKIIGTQELKAGNPLEALVVPLAYGRLDEGWWRKYRQLCLEPLFVDKLPEEEKKDRLLKGFKHSYFCEFNLRYKMKDWEGALPFAKKFLEDDSYYGLASLNPRVLKKWIYDPLDNGDFDTVKRFTDKEQVRKFVFTTIAQELGLDTKRYGFLLNRYVDVFLFYGNILNSNDPTGAFVGQVLGGSVGPTHYAMLMSAVVFENLGMKEEAKILYSRAYLLMNYYREYALFISRIDYPLAGVPTFASLENVVREKLNALGWDYYYVYLRTLRDYVKYYTELWKPTSEVSLEGRYYKVKGRLQIERIKGLPYLAVLGNLYLLDFADSNVRNKLYRDVEELEKKLSIQRRFSL